MDNKNYVHQDCTINIFQIDGMVTLKVTELLHSRFERVWEWEILEMDITAQAACQGLR